MLKMTRKLTTTESLPELVAAVHKCRICHDNPVGKPLPHQPRPVLQVSATARILIVGQAPGTRVHKSGQPFTDPSGVRLREWLGIGEDLFYDPARVAIMAMGFCFPGQDAHGGDLPPRRECAPAWRSQIMGHLSRIELIICLGRHAQAWHMGELVGPTLSQTVANWGAGLKLAPKVLALPHPSWRNSGWLKRNPWFAEDLLPVLRREVKKALR
jgi:uracil-DNA glycosylase family 4